VPASGTLLVPLYPDQAVTIGFVIEDDRFDGGSNSVEIQRMIHADQVAAVLLAAGQSNRFETGDKLLVDLDGQPLVLHAAKRIMELKPGRKIAVCSVAVGVLLEPLGFEVIINANAGQGMATSLACGIEGAARGDCDAALIILGDMPFVTVRHLRSLLTQWDVEDAPVVGSVTGGVPMPPALFARSFFGRLCEGAGDRGARGLLASAELVSAPAGELADIDTIDDLHRFRSSRGADPETYPALPGNCAP
jgi:molybdenum cofactor cytidylyltransferase